MSATQTDRAEHDVAMLRVMVVDDQTLVRQGIRSLLELSDEVTVVAEAADGDEALALFPSIDLDVVLLDLRMPGRDGLATLRAMADAGMDLPVLVLTTFDDQLAVAAALRAGAKGFLLKDVSLQQLVDAIRRLAGGGRLVQPAVTDRLLRIMSSRSSDLDATPHPEPLTEREMDVLRLAASGWSNREIAQGLHLAEGTVKNHMSSVLVKLGVRDRTRAVLRALEEGLIGPTPLSAQEGR